MTESKGDIAQLLLFRAKEGQDHFDRSLATLCFAALALSLQFSARTHGVWNPLLVASWALYLIAAILAGWRLMAGPQFEKMNYAQLTLQAFVSKRRSELKEPAFLAAIVEGRVLDEQTGTSLSLPEVEAGLKGEQHKLELATVNMASLQKRLKWRFNASLSILLAALALNGVYVSANLFCPGNQP